MELKFSTNQVDSYRIETSVYQGPLDLLLELIENAELDITTLALAQVTDQYLKHLEVLQDLPPDEISAFLVIAAKLLQIKSEALLPQMSSSQEEDGDIGNELARQLIAYKRYKEIADILAERKDQGFQSFIRLSSPEVLLKENLDLSGFGVKELFEIASSILKKDHDRQSISTVVERPRITIKDKINQIAERFAAQSDFTFWELLGNSFSRMDVVITFLALLELIRGQFIRIEQANNFDEIKIIKVKEPEEMLNFGLRNIEF
jgi:segregation and condensation protein A